uniref:Uncharacterized protein n=1 Tax=viral metagenome TaxID=1070528 RepID=A0A6C0C211_9ZZZZ
MRHTLRRVQVLNYSLARPNSRVGMLQSKLQQNQRSIYTHYQKTCILQFKTFPVVLPPLLDMVDSFSIQEWQTCLACGGAVPLPGPQCDCLVYHEKSMVPPTAEMRETSRSSVFWTTTDGGQARFLLHVQDSTWQCSCSEANENETFDMQGKGTSLAHAIVAVLSHMSPMNLKSVLRDFDECIPPHLMHMVRASF